MLHFSDKWLLNKTSANSLGLLSRSLPAWVIYRAAFNILLTFNHWGQSIRAYPISCGEWLPRASGSPAASSLLERPTMVRDGNEQEENLDKEE